MCHGELKLSHLKKSYIVTMQTYQMAIILLFESCDSLSCREIQNTLQLNDETFQKHMQPMIESKLLSASSENLAGETRIELNLDYTNKRTKFKISSALQKETPQEVNNCIYNKLEKRFSNLRFSCRWNTRSTRWMRTENCFCKPPLSESWSRAKSWSTMRWYKRYEV